MRTVTVHLDEDDVLAIDQYQNSFGIDSRGDTVRALFRAGVSAVPLNTAIFEISQASVREHRKYFTEALARFFEEQAALLKGNRP